MWKIVSDGTSQNTQVMYNGEVLKGIQALSVGIHADTSLAQVSIAIVGVAVDIEVPDDQVIVDTVGEVDFLREDPEITKQGTISQEMLLELVEQLAQAGYEDGNPQ